MFNVRIKLRKEYLKFTNDKGEDVEMQGVRVVLGPKVEKFIAFENLTLGRKSTIELLGYTNPNLCQWYYNASAGEEITLKEMEIDDSRKIAVKEIYSNSENEL